jgi:hypothetical protein
VGTGPRVVTCARTCALTNTHTGAPHGPERQSVRFADVQVEQFAFVLLAEAAKIFEDQGQNVDWVFALMAAGSALENGRLSGRSCVASVLRLCCVALLLLGSAWQIGDGFSVVVR